VAGQLSTHRHLHLNLAHGVVSLDHKVVVREAVNVANLLERALEPESRERAGLALELGFEAAGELWTNGG